MSEKGKILLFLCMYKSDNYQQRRELKCVFDAVLMLSSVCVCALQCLIPPTDKHTDSQACCSHTHACECVCVCSGATEKGWGGVCLMGETGDHGD